MLQVRNKVKGRGIRIMADIQGTSLLVRKEDLERLVSELKTKEAEIVTDLETILPYVKTEPLKTSISKRLEKGRACLKALGEGFVPFDSGYFTRTDVKSTWSKKAVKESLDSMPPEVKEVWDKAKEKGVFSSFSVTTGGGDPVLVGNAGGKHFFLASWLDFGKGVTLGMRIKI